MIDYDPHDWRSHLFDVRGSMVREIFGRVALCVAWSAVVAAFDVYVREVHIPSIVHMVLGGAISLLLVFRTNSAYDRFWEGRRMWGSIINESRNLGRSVAVYLRAAPDLQREVIEGTIAFAHATRCRLRNQTETGACATYLKEDELCSLADGAHAPLRVSLRITGALQAARDRGVISDYLLAMIDNNVQLLVDYLGACERIHKTPIPFAYMVHLRRALILYCYSLPFALVQEYTWIAIPLTFFVAYVFFGIEEIGVEIEDPFGTDDNDLPLDRFCEVIESDLRELMPK
jgi:putative membrane protein